MMLASHAMASDTRRGSNQFEHFRDCDGCSEMIVLPSGKYMMGATEEEFRGKDEYRFMYTIETPRHEATVKTFALGKFDVTRGQFAAFAEETGFNGKGCYIFDGKQWLTDMRADWRNPGFQQTDSDPVVCVSWNDAQKFIDWLNSKLPKTEARKYRLPTEAEWEYAARAGTVTATYWGDNPLDQCKYENTRDQSARVLGTTAPIADCTDGYVETAPVGSFKSNPWGLFDMLGNVNEWVADCSEIGYSAHSTKQIDSSRLCLSRSLRGGSWATIPIGIRSAMRIGMRSDIRQSIFGFRLATDLSN
jgi:formylglycine-generating enzyme required for sulfatase activity